MGNVVRTVPDGQPGVGTARPRAGGQPQTREGGRGLGTGDLGALQRTCGSDPTAHRPRSAFGSSVGRRTRCRTARLARPVGANDNQGGAIMTSIFADPDLAAIRRVTPR